MPPNPPSNAHGFAMRSMSLRDMQIPKSEKKISWPPPLPNPGDAPVLKRSAILTQIFNFKHNFTKTFKLFWNKINMVPGEMLEDISVFFRTAISFP